MTPDRPTLADRVLDDSGDALGRINAWSSAIAVVGIIAIFIMYLETFS